MLTKNKITVIFLSISCIFLSIFCYKIDKENKELKTSNNFQNEFKEEMINWLKISGIDTIIASDSLFIKNNFDYKTFFQKMSYVVFELENHNDSILLQKLNLNSKIKLTKEDLKDYKRLKSDFNRLMNSKNTTLNSQKEIVMLKNEYEERINQLISEKSELENSSKKHGYLSFVSLSGAQINYVGEIENNLAHGFGIAMFSNGFRYEGNWLEGKKSGKGIYFYKNNEKYEGDFFNGVREGTGTYYFSNGDQYIGEWKNDKRNGIGYILKKKGNISKKGNWIDDKFID
jgi:hypothetical protein